MPKCNKFFGIHANITMSLFDCAMMCCIGAVSSIISMIFLAFFLPFTSNADIRRLIKFFAVWGFVRRTDIVAVNIRAGFASG